MGKKIMGILVVGLLLLTITPLVSSEKIENGFEQSDYKFDVFHSIRLFGKTGRPISAIFQSWNPIYQIFLKFLDIESFSIFEDNEEPDFLQAEMKIRSFTFSEIRSCYAIYWEYNNIKYFVGTNIHTNGEYISSIAGYFDNDNKAISTPIDGEIRVEENILSWVIPKDVIGYPNVGDQIKNIHASTFLLLQKDCESLITLQLATDKAPFTINEDYSYTIQY